MSVSTTGRTLRSSQTPVKVGTNKTSKVELRKLKTGLVYDERMLETRHQWLPDHAEKPERISVCYNRAKELGLVDRCLKIEPRYATESEIAEIHSEGLLQDMRLSEKATEEELIKLGEKHGTHFDHAAFRCALLSSGCTLNLVDAILSGQCNNGMAIIRPPGHHASCDKANGYCFFNNAALAAHRAITKHGLRRILIVDWDLHHGQGTQRLFYNSRDVLYMSIHRYEYAQFWPYLRESDFDYIGAGKGRGFNINVPLNKTGLSDSDYLAVFQQIILPVAREYNPELVIISAGYDAALGCPEGLMTITPACYAHMTHSLRQFAGGKLCVLLEGGYNLKSLAESAALTLRDLLGDPCPHLPMGAVVPCDPVLVRTLLLLMKTLRPFWPNVFAYQGKSSSDDSHWKNWMSTVVKRRSKARFIDEYRPTFDLWTIDQNTGHQSPEIAAEYDRQIDKVLFVPRPLPRYSRLCVLLSDGEAMLVHKAPPQELGHPECPDRLISITNRLKEHVLCDEFVNEGFVEILKSRPATLEELLTVHSKGHIDDVFRLPFMSAQDAQNWALAQNSLYACPDSQMSALHAVGGLIEAVDAVMTGRSAHAFAAIRPPGHHSDSDCASGFCLFNNVAVAAKVARQKYNVKRCLIVDWDVHFGDGTSAIFLDDPAVLYVSLHRFENGRFYPGKEDGNYDNVGEWQGRGFNVNIPFSGGRMGPSEYLAAFERVVMPIAYEYNPELVFISAGFDAAVGDPLGGYGVTPEAYGQMTMYLSALASGRCIVALEGGYNLSSIAEASESCCRALLGLTPPFNIIGLEKPLASAIDTISLVLDTQAEFWRCLSPFRVSMPADAGIESAAQNKSASAKNGGSKNIRRQLETPSPGLAVASTSPSSMPPPPPMQTPVVPIPVTEKTGLLDENALSEAFQRVSILSSSGSSTSPSVAQALGLSTGSRNLANEDETESGFLVTVLPRCPHVETISCRKQSELPSGLGHGTSCDSCGDHLESWICLSCFQIGCGRHRSGHAAAHFEQTAGRHAMAFGFADMSMWCYGCESYIEPLNAGAFYETVYRQRFGESPPEVTKR